MPNSPPPPEGLFDPPAGLPARPGMPGASPISVSELNRRVRHLIESRLELMWVAGELSNVIRAASGHWYFSLKDSDAQVRCVMFRNKAASVGFTPANGMQVEVRALPSLYEPRGDFQLGVETMRRAGLGALFEAYERLKAKLAAEGLFDESRKQALPAFPARLGIVTSLKAAALRDVITTMRRRAPMVGIVVYPAAVQGADAGRELAAAVDAARMRADADGIEALIVCRGGGSLEDLWSFNDEGLVRAIARFQADARRPVVSGVGHETDFTLCDFVADRRAPTPTAAAEMLTPDVAELRARAGTLRAQLRRCLVRRLERAGQQVDQAARRLLSPAERLARERERLAVQAARLARAHRALRETLAFDVALLAQRLAAAAVDVAAVREGVDGRRRRLAAALRDTLAARRAARDAAAQALLHLNPERVLERGYGIVSHAGRVLRDPAAVGAGDVLDVRLAAGSLTATVRR